MSGLEKPLYLTKHTLFLLFLQVVSVFVRSPHALTDMVRHGVQGCKRVGKGRASPGALPGSTFPSPPLYRIIKWFGLEETVKVISPNPLAWTGTPSTRPGCSKSCPTWS